MVLHIGEKDYKVEFTFEAAESEVVNKAYDFFSGAFLAKHADEVGDNKSKQLDIIVQGIADTPKLAIDFLYMGLLENHGPYGDGTVTSREDAKLLYKQYCKENPDSELAYHSKLFNALRDQMEEDGFFKRIGLDTMMQAAQKQAKATSPNTKKSNPSKVKA